MAMDLYGRANRLTRSHFVAAGVRLGVRERPLTRMIDDLVDAAQDWRWRCGEIGFAERETEMLAGLLRERIRSLG